MESQMIKNPQPQTEDLPMLEAPVLNRPISSGHPVTGVSMKPRNDGPEGTEALAELEDRFNRASEKF